VTGVTLDGGGKGARLEEIIATLMTAYPLATDLSKELTTCPTGPSGEIVGKHICE